MRESQLVDLPRPLKPRPERVQFQWQIQYACNYRCPYCVFEGQWESVLKLDRKDIKTEDWIAVWKRMHRDYGAGDIFITGGEPSYYRNFVGLLRELTELHYVSFDTNLSWSWDDLKTFVATVGKRSIRLDTSFHSHSVSVEEYIAKASFLRDNGINYVCRLVAWPPLLPKVEEYRAAFDKAGLTFVVYPFNGSWEGKDYPGAYTDAERDLIRGRTEELRGDPKNGDQADYVGHMVNMHREPPAGRLCRSGFIYARVLPDGTVYRCQPYESRWQEPLGNIFEEGFALRSEPTLCKSQWCEFEYRYLVDQRNG
jgi:MoaA/NifB/PqqE/SkfB family radical SAM enzyme